MATADPPAPASTLPRPPATSQQVIIGVGALTLTKGADVLTTVGGLRLAPALRESNPLAAAAIQQVGVLPALLGLGTVTVLIVALLTELGVVAVRRFPGTTVPDRLAVRLVGYGLASIINLAVAAHNVALFLTV
jgi:hypothetical protein